MTCDVRQSLLAVLTLSFLYTTICIQIISFHNIIRDHSPQFGISLTADVSSAAMLQNHETLRVAICTCSQWTSSKKFCYRTPRMEVDLSQSRTQDSWGHLAIVRNNGFDAAAPMVFRIRGSPAHLSQYFVVCHFTVYQFDHCRRVEASKDGSNFLKFEKKRRFELGQ